MAIVTVNLVDTFDEWRVKTNTLGTETGDLANLATDNKTSIVAAINEVDTNADLSLKNIVEDTTPQLGGDLDLNDKDIIGTGNMMITGDITATSFSGRIEIQQDPNPELGGDLDLSSQNITGTGNINITGDITATGAISGATLSGNLGANLGLNSNDITGTGNINITGNITATSITGATTLAGTVTGVTQAPSDNSTKLATTAYVDAQVETENTLDEMNDTNLTTPTDGQTLTYDAANSEWVNSTPVTGGISLALAIAVS